MSWSTTRGGGRVLRRARARVARLCALGAELVGEVAQYEELYRLCHLRGPAGIIVALAQELG